MEKRQGKKLVILLVEDDVVDVKTIQRAMTFNGTPPPLISVTKNGEDALQYLRRRGKYGDPEKSPHPGIILLDLNLPKMSGIEFLQEVKSDKELKAIPVVVFTTSENEHDRIQSFHACVAGYFVKPMDFDKFIETIQLIIRYWTLSKRP